MSHSHRRKRGEGSFRRPMSPPRKMKDGYFPQATFRRLLFGFPNYKMSKGARNEEILFIQFFKRFTMDKKPFLSNVVNLLDLYKDLQHLFSAKNLIWISLTK